MKVAKEKPKGILYQKYHNTITKLRRQELWSPKKTVLQTCKNNLIKLDDPVYDEINGKFI